MKRPEKVLPRQILRTIMKSRGTPWLRLKVLVAAVLLTMLPLDRSSAEIGNAQAPATGDYRDDRILAKPKSTANENELQNLQFVLVGRAFGLGQDPVVSIISCCRSLRIPNLSG